MRLEPAHPALGVGVGLRRPHYAYFHEQQPEVGWFEVHSENFMGTERAGFGPAARMLEGLRERYSVSLHGVSMSLGSADALHRPYMAKLRALVERIEPAFVSDHLCWTGVDGRNLHDLLPLPYTEAVARHVAEKILAAQEYLGRRILVENLSSYVTFAHSEMTEWEFLTEIAQKADCLLLLDVNNIFVSASNHGFDPRCYLNAIPPERVAELHLAGFSDMTTHLLDTHAEPVDERVWELYAHAVDRFGAVPTLLERDDNIPDFPVLELELIHARRIHNRALAAGAATLARVDHH